MKRALIIFSILTILAAPASAFLYESIILSKEQIAKLSDEQLEEAYIEAKIEDNASKEFHEAAGFSSKKDYVKRKELMRYIFELRREMGRRETIDAESIDKYFK